MPPSASPGSPSQAIHTRASRAGAAVGQLRLRRERSNDSIRGLKTFSHVVPRTRPDAASTSTRSTWFTRS